MKWYQTKIEITNTYNVKLNTDESGKVELNSGEYYCHNCNGTGSIFSKHAYEGKDICTFCFGTGALDFIENINGQRIRSNISKDLEKYLVIKTIEHSVFNNLFYTLQNKFDSFDDLLNMIKFTISELKHQNPTIKEFHIKTNQIVSKILEIYIWIRLFKKTQEGFIYVQIDISL